MEQIVNQNKSIRISWIDISKALLIFEVVLCHTLRIGNLDVFASSYAVPCFFILSGFLFKRKKISLSLFDGFKKIMIPYLFFGVISIVVYTLIGKNVSSTLNVNVNDFSFLTNFYGLLYCNCKTGYMKWNTPLFFLPSYYISYQIVNILENIVFKRNDNVKRIALILFGFVLSIFLTNCKDVCLPFSLEASFFHISFIEVGIVFKSVLIKQYNRKKMLILSILLFLVGFYISINNYPYGIHVFILGKNSILYIINVFILSSATILFSKFIDRSSILEIIGKNTIGILCLHKFPVLFFITYVPFASSIMTNNNESILYDFIGITISIISIFLCLLCIYVIKMLCPFILGSKSKSNIFRND